MAPKTRAKSAKAGAKYSNPKRIKSKLDIQTREDDSKITKRCRHCGASLRSEDMETTLQDTVNAAANVFAAPLDSIETLDPRESAEVPSPTVLPEWNGRRRRSRLPTREELEVADFLVTKEFCRKWASGSAAATMVHMTKDPNYFAPVQICVSSRATAHSTGPSFIATCEIPIQVYSTMASSGLQPKFCKFYG